MSRWERWGLALTILGTAIALIGLPAAVPRTPEWILVICFWVGILMLPAAALFAGWETRPLRSLRQKLGFSDTRRLKMDAAVAYIWQQSRWACEHENDTQWFMTLQRDVRDALRMGHIVAYGRPAALGQISSSTAFGGAMQPIDAEHWQVYRPEIFDGLSGNQTANFSASAANSSKGFYDIHFDLAQLKETWPPITLIDRFRHKPLVLR